MCIETSTIVLCFGGGIDPYVRLYNGDVKLDHIAGRSLDGFAKTDGFESWNDLVTFWRVEHPDIGDFFAGVIVRWK